MAWHPPSRESPSRRKRWARLQAAWAKAGQADFRDLPDWNEPAKPTEADTDRTARPMPAPVGRPPHRRGGKL